MTIGPVNLDEFANRLRQTEPVIDDGEFTAAVIAQLPGTGGLPARVRGALLLGATALGSAIVAARIPLPAVIELVEQALAIGPVMLLPAAVMAYATSIIAIWATRYA